MKLANLATVLVAGLALGAVLASSALASAVTKDVTWRTGSSGTSLSGPETVSSSGDNELVWTVGVTSLRLNSTGLECIECKIENSGGAAIGTGNLKFTGVTVAAPSSCKVNGGAVTTLALKFFPDWMVGATDYWNFEAASGTSFATVKLEAGTGSCPLSGNYIVTGLVFTRSTSETGAYGKEQTVTSSGPINSEDERLAG